MSMTSPAGKSTANAEIGRVNRTARIKRNARDVRLLPRVVQVYRSDTSRSLAKFGVKQVVNGNCLSGRILKGVSAFGESVHHAA